MTTRSSVHFLRRVSRTTADDHTLSVDDPSSGLTRFVHDEAGNVVGRTDARGVTTTSSYDGANRVLGYWDAADPEGTAVRFRYDFGGDCAAGDCTNGEGHAIEISYPLDPVLVERLGGAGRGVDHLGFDTRGQRIYEARQLARVRLVTERVFDNAGRQVATIYPDGRRLDSHLDGASRLTAIAGVIREVRYGARGELTELVHANGTADEWAHDGRLRTSRRTHRGSGGAVLETELIRSATVFTTAAETSASALAPTVDRLSRSRPASTA